jgi:hypothetical protein
MNGKSIANFNAMKGFRNDVQIMKREISLHCIFIINICYIKGESMDMREAEKNFSIHIQKIFEI